MSDNRSGSTLLDQLLGAHSSIISLGEVSHLPAYVLNDRSIYNPSHPLVCSCGDQIADCEFWKRAAERIERSLDQLQLKARFYDRRQPRTATERLAQILTRRILYRWPRLSNTQAFRSLLLAEKVGADSFELFDAIFNSTGADFLVDSSKDPRRMRFIYEHDPSRVFVIMLGRDVRGIVHSKMKRGRELVAGAEGWARCMNMMKIAIDGVPSANVMRMKYEDLCENPESELQRICDRLSIDFSAEMLTRPSADVHHLGGSPSKFDPARRSISLDQSYMTAFSSEQLVQIREIAGSAAEEWGYDLSQV